MDMILVSNYRRNQRLFSSLDELAEEMFGITLLRWRDERLMGENYIPYSYISSGRILANVSVNLYTCRIREKTYPVAQIGTVMTAPDARGKGLSGRLMRYVLSLYEKQNLFIFLFANASVLDFYPRFGFVGVPQRRYLFLVSEIEPTAGDFRPVSYRNEADREIILRTADTRVPLAASFSLKGDQSPRRIYLSSEECEGTLFYSDRHGALVCAVREEETLRVRALFPAANPNRRRTEWNDTVLRSLPYGTAKEVECEFTLDSSFPNRASGLYDDKNARLFIRPGEPMRLPDGKVIYPDYSDREDSDVLDLTGLRFSELDHT